MTSFQIIALYVALHLLLLLALAMRVGNQRGASKVSLGDGGDPDLLARVRAHGNFTETAPFAIIGLMALAMMNAHPIALHVFGAGFFIGRILHAHGMNQKDALGKGRSLGMLLTALVFLGEALYLLFLVFTFSIT